jgi:hypothetical protein
MPNIRDSKRLIPLGRLPVLPAWVSGSRAYGAMSSSNSGAVIATDGEIPAYLITAPFLKAAIRVAADELGIESATVMPLTKHLIRLWKTDDQLSATLKSKIDEESPNPSPIPEKFFAVVISQDSISINATVPEDSIHDVVPVNDADGISAGWYFGNDQLLEIIQTPPAAWYCQNYNHPNGDPDTGKCHTCGGPMKK